MFHRSLSLRSIGTALALSVGIGAGTQATAAVIAEYTIASGSIAASSVSANLTASNIAENGSAAFTGNSATSAATSTYFVNAADVFGSITAATTDYLTFTLTPAAGYQINLTGLSFDHGASNSTTGSKSFTSTIQVRSSVDAFASSLLASDFAFTGTNVPAIQWKPTEPSVVLASTVLTPVEFRVYFTDTYSADRALSHRISDIEVLGSVTLIPEPASLALLAMGSMLVLTRRRSQTVSA